MRHRRSRPWLPLAVLLVFVGVACTSGDGRPTSAEALDGALDDRDWAAVDARLDELARSCNQCRRVTDHGFVKIDLSDVPNAYPQDVSTSK